MEVKDVNMTCHYCDRAYVDNHFYWVKSAMDKDVTICPLCADKPLTNNEQVR